MALTTVAKVKTRAGIPDGNDDTLLGDLVTEISDWITDTTGRTFEPLAGATYQLDTFAGLELEIPRGIRTLTTVGVATTDQVDGAGAGAYTNVPPADLLIRPASIDRRPGWPGTSILFSRGTLSGTISRFGTARNGCRIVGDFGFAAVPPAIESIAIAAVVTAYGMRKAGLAGAVGSDSERPPVVWSSLLTLADRRILDRYTYPGIG